MAVKTNLFKFIFIVLLLLSLIFSLISLLTPAWRIYQFHKGQISFGLITSDCYDNNNYEVVESRKEEVVVTSAVQKVTITNAPSTVVEKTIVTKEKRSITVDGEPVRKGSICNQRSMAWRDYYENATTLIIIFAIITLIIALFTSCVLQCIMPRFYWISPVLAFITAIFLIIAIIIYTINADKYILPVVTTPAPVVTDGVNMEVVVPENTVPYNFGYSFWFAFAAMITAFIAAMFGCMASANFGDEHTSRMLVQSYITSATK